MPSQNVNSRRFACRGFGNCSAGVRGIRGGCSLCGCSWCFWTLRNPFKGSARPRSALSVRVLVNYVLRCYIPYIEHTRTGASLAGGARFGFDGTDLANRFRLFLYSRVSRYGFHAYKVNTLFVRRQAAGIVRTAQCIAVALSISLRHNKSTVNILVILWVRSALKYHSYRVIVTRCGLPAWRHGTRP